MTKQQFKTHISFN